MNHVVAALLTDHVACMSRFWVVSCGTEWLHVGRDMPSVGSALIYIGRIILVPVGGGHFRYHNRQHFRAVTGFIYVQEYGLRL